jgi:xylulokinase
VGVSGTARKGLCIGLDVGTSGIKGILIDAHGAVVARAGAGYPLLTPRAGWTEQAPDEWWRASRAVLRELRAEAGAPIAALGLTGQMHGAVFLDAAGAVIRPALLWNDQRTAAECAEIERRVGPERLRRIAGNPALTGFQAPKVLWLRHHEPEAYARVRHLLLPKDFIRHRLTGGFATDASDAAGTLLLDLARRDWSEEILDALAIPREWLPRVHEGPEVTGRISAEAARATGLPEGLPVVAGGGDNAAAAVGSGVVRPGTGFVSLGTSGVVFVPSARLEIDPTGGLHAFCHAVPGQYHLMGVVLSAGGSLRWFRDALAPELAARAEREDRDPYDALLADAEAIAPGAEGLFFLPYLSGERTPHMDPHARGAWLGLTLAHGRAHLVRAVLEGVSFALKDALVPMQRLGVSPDVLYAVGGGARGPLWRRILAAVLGVPLQPLAVEEGPALGAALLASVGAGIHPDVEAAVAATVRPAGPAEPPDPDWQSLYENLYARFTTLYPALRQTGLWRPEC